ncbi:MAG: hybrid sensor histidine kinase/response regulator [Methanospirillaceae archaeon]|nr:hybrid sensor histidine kinase/response regulator [Methanospirillaceae archaeon]
MDQKEKEFLERLLATFQDEAHEHLTTISAGLLTLESGDNITDNATIETVFRETHSLKGAARAVGLNDIEVLCQNLENVFSGMKKGKITLIHEDYDLIHTVIDEVTRLLHEKRDPLLLTETDTRPLTARLRDLLEARQVSFVPEPEPAEGGTQKSHDSDTGLIEQDKGRINTENHAGIKNQEQEYPIEPVVSADQKSSVPEQKRSVPLPASGNKPPLTTIRISPERVDSLFSRTEDLRMIQLAQTHYSTDIRNTSSLFQEWRWNYSQIQTDLDQVKNLIASAPDSKSLLQENQKIAVLFDFLQYSCDLIRTLQNQCQKFSLQSKKQHTDLEGIITGISEEMKQILLVPVSSVLDMYPRMVRDVSHAKGKEIQLKMEGTGIEIDRRVLEGIRDPLTHLIRNCIDHGIEEKSKRKERGKPEKGTITISVSYSSGSRAEIQVADDGSGIDPEQIKKVAIARNFLNPKEAESLSDADAVDLIFLSDISTSAIITDTSGRGLGCAIVRDNTEALGGEVTVRTKRGQGTTFTLSIPLSLATFQGLLVSVSDHLYVLPIQSVDRAGRVKDGNITTVENRMMIQLPDVQVAAVSLASLLQIPPSGERKPVLEQSFVLIESGKRKIAVLVDAVLGSYPLIVKNMGKQIRKADNITGMTILGDGTVVPVLHVKDLLTSALSGKTHAIPLADSENPKEVKHHVIIVEDSITSRMMLKNIIEGAGYLVEVAADGIEAFEKLKTDTFDIVVSDVDMPRMNGFTLCEKIRDDTKLQEIPVVLVTSLDSQEDREHGIRCGADAYIVKSSFDQTNLLEIMKRLL